MERGILTRFGGVKLNKLLFQIITDISYISAALKSRGIYYTPAPGR